MHTCLPSSTWEGTIAFQSTKLDDRSFLHERCVKFPWLHCNVMQDAAFCHTCMRVESEKRFPASTKRDPTFIKKGFTYWKEATSAFSRYQASACQKEAASATALLQKVGDIGELLSSAHQQQKTENRNMFPKILENLHFLSCQGLAF